MLQSDEIPVQPRRRLWLGRVAWLVLAILVAIYCLAVVPIDVRNYPDRWEAVSSYPALDSLLSFSAYSFYLLALRYLVLLFSFFVALLIFIQLGLADSRHAPVALLAASLLILFPLLVILGSSGVDLPYARPWDQVLETIGLMLGLLCFPLLVWFYFVFPDGHFRPGWLRWLGVTLAVVIVLMFYLSATQAISGEWWPFAMLAFLVALVAGIALQIYRYRVLASAAEKSRTRWVIASLLLLPVLTILGSSLPALVNIHLQALSVALLPTALLISIFKHGLWAVRLSPRRVRGYGYLAGVLAVTSLVCLFWFNRAYQLEAYPAINFEPLPQTDRKLPVVIDTDMAADDWMAILFLLQRPDVRVKAIAITGTGEAHCKPGVRNALGLVALAGNDPIPVACGRETPLAGNREFPQAWREGVDQMLGLLLPEGSNPYTSGDAVDLLLSTARSSPVKVVLLTLGPLTNVAEAIQREPTFIENIQQIVIMGGALQVPGNVFYSNVGIENKDAEWNVFIDPLAAKIVIESGAQVTLVPLDATNQVPADLSFYRKLQSNRKTPEAEFIYQVLSNKLDMILPGVYYFWDPLAAAVAVDESFGYIKDGLVRVIAEPGVHSGATRLVNHGVPVHYAKSADHERFVFEFLRALNQE
jgi:pyrimidine-specific ribonucleoside hydrolase